MESGWEQVVKPLIPRRIADIKEISYWDQILRAPQPGSRNLPSEPLSDGSRGEPS